MRDGRSVEAEAFLRLAEVPADDVGEGVQIDGGVGVEGIKIVERDQPRRTIPFMRPRILVVGANIGLWLIVRAEEVDIGLRVFVTDLGIWKEAQGLMVAHGP